MPTKIYLVTRSTRYKSLSTYEKSIDEICAFETFSDALRFFYDSKNELFETGYLSIGSSKETIDGEVFNKTLIFVKQSVIIHLTIQQISYLSKTPKL